MLRLSMFGLSLLVAGAVASACVKDCKNIEAMGGFKIGSGNYCYEFQQVTGRLVFADDHDGQDPPDDADCPIDPQTMMPASTQEVSTYNPSQCTLECANLPSYVTDIDGVPVGTIGFGCYICNDD